jgi:uncharacterized protein (DUF1800 family)
MLLYGRTLGNYRRRNLTSVRSNQNAKPWRFAVRTRPSILLLAFVTVATTVNLYAQGQADRSSFSDHQILHVLNRLTFGPHLGDVERVRKMGLQEWIQSQLHPEVIPENPALEEKLKPLNSLRMSLAQSMESTAAGLVFVNGVGQLSNVLRTADGTVRMMAPSAQTPETDLRDGKIFRAIYSNRQLEEVLVDFWFNHFNVSSAKARPFVAHYEREAIRPFVLGKFRSMLFSTALHPAMLLYLDNKESIAPEIAQPGPNMTVQFGNARGLNENFSRELMELHTMGVDGGYTQKDIEQAARTFTGWSLRQTPVNPSTKEPAKVEVLFSSWAHDPKDKVVLGHTIAADGYNEVHKLLDILASHPSTARHISFRLAQRFVSDNPPQALVDRVTRTFIDTGGDLGEVTRTLLTSREFLSESTWHKKIKSPLEVVVSAVRAVNGEISTPSALGDWIAEMGQPLYGKIEPNGYPNTGEGWFNTATLLARLNFATSLANGKIPGVTVDTSRWDGKETVAIAREILGRDPMPQTLEALKEGKVAGDVSPAFLGGLILGSPDFQRR